MSELGTTILPYPNVQIHRTNKKIERLDDTLHVENGHIDISNIPSNVTEYWAVVSFVTDLRKIGLSVEHSKTSLIERVRSISISLA